MILVVEHDPSSAGLLRRRLQALDPDVIVARSFEEAVGVVDTVVARAVVSGFELDGRKSGLDVLAYVAARLPSARRVLYAVALPMSARARAFETAHAVVDRGRGLDGIVAAVAR